MTTTINQDEALFEILDMYSEGKSKSEVSATLTSKGLSKDLAEAMAEAGINAFTARLSYVDKENDRINEGMRRHIKEVSYEIEKGRNKEEIISWLMQQDMPLSLATNLLEAGLGLYSHVVSEHRKKAFIKAHVVIAASLGLVVWSYMEEYRLPYVFAASLAMVGISMYRDANEAASSRLAKWIN